MKDYYQILGVERFASEQEIKQAYRRMAMQHHPDRNDSPDANDLLVEINEAYSVLSDRDKRAGYDRKIEDMYFAWTFVQAHREYTSAKEEQEAESEHEQERTPVDLEARLWYERLDFRDEKARKVGQMISKFFVAFLMLLALDFSLPYVDHQVRIEQTRLGKEWSNMNAEDFCYFKVEDREYSTPSTENSRSVTPGKHAILQKTPMLHTPRYLHVYAQESLKMWAYGTFYDYYLVLLILLGIIAFIGLSADGSPDLHLYSFIMGSLTFILVLILWWVG